MPLNNRHRAPATRLVWSRSAVVPTVPDVPDTSSEEDAYLVRLGATIRRVRKQLLHLNQDQLGERIGRDKNTVSRWENGKTSLSAYNLIQLWQALEVPAEWLLDPTDSVTELDRRIAQLRRAAAEAARDDEADGPDQPSAGGAGVPRGRR